MYSGTTATIIMNQLVRFYDNFPQIPILKMFVFMIAKPVKSNDIQNFELLKFRDEKIC